MQQTGNYGKKWLRTSNQRNTGKSDTDRWYVIYFYVSYENSEVKSVKNTCGNSAYSKTDYTIPISTFAAVQSLKHS
jgi:hypothetical protein